MIINKIISKIVIIIIMIIIMIMIIILIMVIFAKWWGNEMRVRGSLVITIIHL